MPKLPEIQLDIMHDLLEQQRYSPRAALLRTVERAEALAASIDHSELYDERDVRAGVTGFRPEIDEPALIAGGAVLGDLSAIVEHLCDAAKLSHRDVPSGSITTNALAERLGVTRRTIERYRRQGLIARRVRDDRGRVILLFTPHAVDTFGTRRHEQIARAGGFARLSDDDEQALYAHALELLGTPTETGERRTPAAAIAAAAAAAGRSRDAVRRAVQQRDESSDHPRFARAWRKTDAWARRRIGRALAWGVPPRLVARRYARSPATVRRLGAEWRAARLRTTLPTLPVSERNETPPANDELVRSIKPLDMPRNLRDLVDRAAATPPASASYERDLAAAHRALLLRARRVIESLPSYGPSSPMIDRAETDLRHALRLRLAMLALELPLIVRTLESRAAGSLLRVPPADARRLVDIAVRAALDALGSAPRLTGGRLAAPISLAMNRRLAAMPTPRGDPSRAVGGVPIDPATFTPAPWAAIVLPHPRLRPALDELEPLDAELHALRFGWTNQTNFRPLTVAEAATYAGVTPPKVAGADRRARAFIRTRVNRA